jgi:hypothetical protein
MSRNRMISAGSSARQGVESRDVWVAARRFSLYELADNELDALIVRHRGGPLMADRVIVEASRHVRDLRRSLASGEAR